MAKKILIADDSLFMRKMLKDFLSDKYDVMEAESASETQKKIKKEKPDLLLLDIIMPEGEEAGISVLKAVMKADPRQKVIMITAVGQDSIVSECKKAGAADYIVKPFDKEKVIKTVEKYLS
jgi:two-component system chemotaxis response regulator CheY